MGSKEVILAKVHGGLGNQMFQYACGFSLAKEYNLPFYLEIADFERGKVRDDFTLREFQLNQFCIESDLYKGSSFSRYVYPLSVTKQIEYSIKFLLKKPVFVIIDEGNFVLHKKIIGKYSIYLDGYWQDETYFDKFESEIRNQFTPKYSLGTHNEVLLSKINSFDNSVSIHVRRGDYVNNKRYIKKYGFSGLEYYTRAIEFLFNRLGNPVFFVFSDDFDWVMTNLQLERVIYVNNDNESWQDLALMQHCKHNIIANSTFSWWGAWLNRNPRKIVIAPQKWYSDDHLNEERKDLVPKSWIRL